MHIPAFTMSSILTPQAGLPGPGGDPGSASAAALRGEVLEALRQHPEALRRDPELRRAVDRLQAMENALGRIRGHGKRARKARSQTRRMHSDLLHRLRRRLKTLSPSRRLPDPDARHLGQAATERYGDDLGGQIQNLLHSGLPFDQLILMVGALMNDHYESEVRDVMGKMADQASSSDRQGQTGGALDGALSIVSGLGTYAVAAGVGPVAGAVTRAATGAKGATQTTSENQLQAELQYAMQKMKQWQTLLSNLSSLTHKMAEVAINNIGRA